MLFWQCKCIVNWTLGNKFQLKLIQNIIIFRQENEFSSAKWWPFCRGLNVLITCLPVTSRCRWLNIRHEALGKISQDHIRPAYNLKLFSPYIPVVTAKLWTPCNGNLNINWSRVSNVSMEHKSKPSLVQIIVCICSALSYHVDWYCLIINWTLSNRLQCNLYQNINLQSRKSMWKCRLQNEG